MLRKSVWFSVFVLAVAAGVAVAGPKESAKVEVPYEVSWAGKVLPAGEYTFQWQGQGADLDVTVLRGRQVVAQGHGRLEEAKQTPSANAVGTRRDTSGARVLTRVEFRGEATVLKLS